MDSADLEDWLLDAGDAVLRKREAEGREALSPLEKAILNLWVVDYAVRNSGTLWPMREMEPNALTELSQFAQSENCKALSSWLSGAGDETAFCSNYYTLFPAACDEFRQRVHCV